VVAINFYLINIDMEFKGRIAKVLPMRSGTSQRGNEWKALPFVFEYFENETDRYADSVLVETFDTNIIDGLLSMCTKNPDGTPVVKDGAYDLIREIHCICGFGHKIRTFTNQNGETKTMNEIRLYKLESIKEDKGTQKPVQPANIQQPTTTPQTVLGGPQTPPFPPFGSPINQGANDDDLPF
jgi:hypothetical protein